MSDQRGFHAGRGKALDQLPTEGFSSWLERTRRARKTKEGASVPCGECRGCCTSSYFIHIRPDEAETLAKIPKRLLFAAPGLPKGHVLMGYDERGHCPMFVDNRCSIYAHRPQTCRDYDCRIFPATGLSPGEDKPVISRQADRWKFDLSTEEDRRHLKAARSAAKFLRKHADAFPAGFVPNNPTQQAVLALKVYRVFLDATDAPVPKTVEAIVAAHKKFERQ